MSTSARKKLERQKAHAKEKAQRQYEKMLASTKAKKKQKEFVEYAPPQSYVRDTKSYPSVSLSNAIPESCGRKERQEYTGDLIVGIATMHKSNAVPVMRGTSQAEDIAKMRRG